LLVAISVAGWLASYLQGLFGLSDQGGLLAPKLLAAGLVLALFSAWMLSLACSFWGSLWVTAAGLVRAPWPPGRSCGRCGA
jgi:flagellar biosynthesis protein FliQ